MTTSTQSLVENRVAAVTGAGKGLGKSYALWLARQGCSVVVNNRTHTGVSSSAQELVDQINSEGFTAIAHEGAVDDREAAAGIAQTAIDTFGKLDIMICNAGIMPDAPFAEADLDDIERLVRINMLGTLYPLQPAWQHMLERKYGRIVLTGSTVGIYGYPGVAAYGSTRAGMIGLARSLTGEVPEGADITVNTIMPFAHTPLSADSIDAEMGSELRAMIHPDAIAPTVGWLCSEACQTSGQTYHASAYKATRVGIVESSPVSVDPEDLAALSEQDFGLEPLFEPTASTEAVGRLLGG
ncbi:MAG: SDR family NAD(P)-dependent oxidoreductase [Novosphingobium sp.]|nr:SDR family NAD(P)-dependent oxidoreductase [Novosphingobium sp.]